MTALLFVLAAATGTAIRYVAGRHHFSISHWSGDLAFVPWGTLTVNVFGSYLLGITTGMGPVGRVVLGAGFCGALTTFSAVSGEVVALADMGRRKIAAGYVALTVALCLIAAAGGLATV